MEERLKGIVVAMVTPFHDDESLDEELSLEARLSNIFFLKGSVIREQLGNTGEVGERYNLDFRLKFEY